MPKLSQLDSFGEIVGHFAGDEVQAKVMQGYEKITASAKPEKVALWTKGAIDRLDELVPEGTRQQIMQECGYACALMNKNAMARGKARRAKYKTLDEYLAAEEKNPSSGTRLAWDGKIIRQYYIPRKWSHPMRCFCGIMRGLPENETTSQTYCQCSRGFVQKFWEGVLERPVEVELGLTAISGADECEFIIH